MRMISAIYEKAGSWPMLPEDIVRRVLLQETRDCVARELQLPAHMIPNKWRKMAHKLNPELGKGMHKVARALDACRVKHGLDPAIREYFKECRARQR